jgi:aryl-alcohol dehydrogenase-like predicted oxidoreductase
MTWGEQNSAREAHQQIDLALERGINFIDTAELYPSPVRAATYGHTEKIIGDWLRRNDRSTIVLASKVVGPAPKKWIGHIRNGPQLDAGQIEQAIDASLQRLTTDYIDLYQIHWPARSTNYFDKTGYDYTADKHDTPIHETLQALHKLVASGKVRALGVCNETPWGLHTYLDAAKTANETGICCIQNPYNLLNRSYEIGLAEFAHRSNIGLLAYSPLGCGQLSGKYLNGTASDHARLNLHANYFYRYTTDTAIEATAQYCAIAAEHGLSPVQLALAFVASRPFVVSTIIGATDTTQLEQNIAALGTPLDASAIRAIEKVHRHHANPCS